MDTEVCETYNALENEEIRIMPDELRLIQNLWMEEAIFAFFVDALQSHNFPNRKEDVRKYIHEWVDGYFP